MRKINCFCLVMAAVLTLQMFLPMRSFSSGLFYTIQTGSFPDIEDAQKKYNLIEQRLNEKDLAYLRMEKIGKYYSVRIGKFEDYSSAEEYFRVHESKLSGAIIMRAI